MDSISIGEFGRNVMYLVVPNLKSLRVMGLVAVLPPSKKVKSVETLRELDCSSTTMKSNILVVSGCKIPRKINSRRMGVMVEVPELSSIFNRNFLPDSAVKSTD